MEFIPTTLRRALWALAIVVTGCASAPPVVEPTCANSIPLGGRWDRRAPGYIVRLRAGIDSRTVMTAYTQQYGFVARSIGEPYFFIEEIAPAALADLRCERDVVAIFHDANLGNIIAASGI
jgi:hypothetical protein